MTRPPGKARCKVSITFFITFFSFLFIISDNQAQDDTPLNDTLPNIIQTNNISPEMYPRAVTDILVKDKPNDAGGAIIIMGQPPEIGVKTRGDIPPKRPLVKGGIKQIQWCCGYI